MSDELTVCRQEIDRLDDQLISLLAERFGIVDRVIDYKQRHGLPADIPDRVQHVLQRVGARAADAGLPDGVSERLWRVLIAETIAYERRKKVP